MTFRIELRYLHGWDDANWTAEKNGVIEPMRFLKIADAQNALDEFLQDAMAAVAVGDLDIEETSEHYRIAPVVE